MTNLKELAVQGRLSKWMHTRATNCGQSVWQHALGAQATSVPRNRRCQGTHRLPCHHAGRSPQRALAHGQDFLRHALENPRLQQVGVSARARGEFANAAVGALARSSLWDGRRTLTQRYSLPSRPMVVATVGKTSRPESVAALQPHAERVRIGERPRRPRAKGRRAAYVSRFG